MGKVQKSFDEFELKEASKDVRAPIFGSTRLVMFIMFLLCTTNFVYQRFNINFVLVCMDRPILKSELNEIDQGENPQPGNVTVTNILANVTKGDSLLETSSLILDDLNNPHSKSIESDVDKNWITSEHIELHKTPEKTCGSGMRRKNESDTIGSEYYLSQFGWSKETQGGIIAAYYYGLTFSQIPCGWLVDKFGSKTLLLLSQLVVSVVSLLSPTSAYLGPEYLFAARLVAGAANGAAMPAMNVLATRWCGDMERSSLLSLLSAGFGVAAAVVYPITAFLCENLGWQSSFYFGGGTGVLWCLIALLLIFEWPENHPRIKMSELQFIQTYRAVQYGGPKRQVIRPPWIAMLTSRPVWAFILANFCCFWCFLTISAYIPTYLKEVLHLDMSENGLLSAIPYIGMLSVHFLAAFSFDWLRRKDISITVLRKSYNSIGMFSSGICIILLGFVPCENVAIAVFLLTCSQVFLELPLMGGYFYSLFEIAPAYASSLTSLCNTFGLLTGFITPAVVSYITTDGTLDQWLIVFYLTGGVMIFGGIVYLLFGKCTLLSWAAEGAGNSVVDGSSGAPLSRNNSKRVEQELKQLKIRLINGESDIKGQTVRS